MIFFDNNATTPVDKEVKEELIRVLEIYGNPSSIHEVGQSARTLLDESRSKVAAFIGAHPDEIIFTSGGTEANNIAIFGLSKGARSVAVSPIEHSSVKRPFEQLENQGIKVKYFDVNTDGTVRVDDIPEGSALVSLMLANNETGVIQPIKTAVEKARAKGALFHADGVQAAGKMKIDVRELGVDTLSISAHKIYAPKGVGVLYVKRGVKINPIMFGGSQEHTLRPGTESLPLISAFAKACEIADKRMNEDEIHINILRDRLESEILKRVVNCEINGAGAKRIANTSSITFGGLKGDMLAINLDLEGLCVSSTSACSSANLKPSHVLTAMGRTENEARASIRFSLGRYSTEEEVVRAAEITADAVESMRSLTW